MAFKEEYEKYYNELPIAPTMGETGNDSCLSINDTILIAQPKTVLEIGFNRGSGALAILLSNDYTKVYSIDIAPRNASVDYLQSKFPNRFEFIQGDSKTIQLPFDKVDFVFIDGDHSYEGVKSDAMMSLLLDADYILFDDYYHIAHGSDIKRVISELQLILVKDYTDFVGQALVKCKG